VQELTAFSAALQAYRARQWDEAQAMFEELGGAAAANLYRVYLDRIPELRALELPSNWDAVFTFDKK
jgi:hypothetical protein